MVEELDIDNMVDTINGFIYQYTDDNLDAFDFLKYLGNFQYLVDLFKNSRLHAMNLTSVGVLLAVMNLKIVFGQTFNLKTNIV